MIVVAYYDLSTLFTVKKILKESIGKLRLGNLHILRWIMRSSVAR